MKRRRNREKLNNKWRSLGFLYIFNSQHVSEKQKRYFYEKFLSRPDVKMFEISSQLLSYSYKNEKKSGEKRLTRARTH